MYVFMDSSSLRRWNKQNNNNLEFHTTPRTNTTIYIFFFAHLQVNTMYAEIPAKEADKLGPMIQVDRTYVIARFKVCNAKKKFKSVPGPYMLEFTCHTKISAATEQITGPKYIYNLTPFEKLPEFINDTKKFHG